MCDHNLSIVLVRFCVHALASPLAVLSVVALMPPPLSQLLPPPPPPPPLPPPLLPLPSRWRLAYGLARVARFTVLTRLVRLLAVAALAAARRVARDLARAVAELLSVRLSLPDWVLLGCEVGFVRRWGCACGFTLLHFHTRHSQLICVRHTRNRTHTHSQTLQ